MGVVIDVLDGLEAIALYPNGDRRKNMHRIYRIAFNITKCNIVFSKSRPVTVEKEQKFKQQLYWSEYGLPVPRNPIQRDPPSTAISPRKLDQHHPLES
jgi:hypothetical protein